jgi:eukaryotic-like serine/threonine-protein kinase
MHLVPGTRLGRYDVRSLLGAGGMGEVYLAHDTTLRRDVAIKVLPNDATRDRERLRRFEQEAQAISSLNHPNILTIHEIAIHDGTVFVATELVDGETLRDRMARERLDAREVLDIGVQIASALAAAHATGIVHRDIKPENIMVRKDGIVKVLDFGLAKLVAPGTTQDAASATKTMADTLPGVVLGTVHYLSPERSEESEAASRHRRGGGASQRGACRSEDSTARTQRAQTLRDPHHRRRGGNRARLRRVLGLFRSHRRWEYRFGGGVAVRQ